MREDTVEGKTRVGGLAARFGLSRATLLYYGRIGLLKPAARSLSGYRLYDGASEDRLRKIVAFRAAGLTIAAIKTLLAAKPQGGDEVILGRIEQIDGDIHKLRAQQRMLIGMLAPSGRRLPPRLDKKAWVKLLRAGGMSAEDMHRWHSAFESRVPESHRDFLLWLGISPEQADRIRLASKKSKPTRAQKAVAGSR
jgi:MerR family transcriptional regulator, thiopeptide resistance regulator